MIKLIDGNMPAERVRGGSGAQLAPVVLVGVVVAVPCPAA